MEQSLTLEKALDLLFEVNASREPRRISELGRQLSIPKSTVHRLLATLARRGLLARTERGAYEPSLALLTLARGVLEREPVVLAARQLIREEAERLGETIFLAGARAGKLLVLDKHEGTGFLRASPRIGDELPAHATAIGKLYLAFAPGDLATERGALHRFTPDTRTDRAGLRHELQEIQTSGLARNRDEWILGLSGVAAPIRPNGRMVAAVAVSGSSARFEFGRFSRGVSRVSRVIEERLLGRPDGRDAEEYDD